MIEDFNDMLEFLHENYNRRRELGFRSEFILVSDDYYMRFLYWLKDLQEKTARYKTLKSSDFENKLERLVINISGEELLIISIGIEEGKFIRVTSGSSNEVLYRNRMYEQEMVEKTEEGIMEELEAL